MRDKNRTKPGIIRDSDNISDPTDDSYIQLMDKIEELANITGLRRVEFYQKIPRATQREIDGKAEEVDVFKHDGEVAMTGTITLENGETIDNKVDGIINITGSVKIGDGGVTNYFEVKADGEINLYGAARVIKTVEFAGASFEKGVSAPDSAVVGNYLVWEYSINDDSVLSFELPHEWAVGTDLTVYLDWSVDRKYSDESAEVQWNIYWSATPKDDTEALTGAGTKLDPGDQNIPSTENFLIRTEMGVISGASLSQDDEMGIKIVRVALDDGSNPGVAKVPYIIHAHITYISNKLGIAT